VAAVGVAVFVYLPPYFAGHLGVSLALVGLMWSLVRIVDIPIDVLIALWMDRTRTRLGRYRLWLLAGAPPFAFAVFMLFMAPAHFSGPYLFAWLLLFYLGNSIVSLAHQAWAASLTRAYHDRSRLFGLINAVGVAGTLATMVVLIAAPAMGFSNAQAVQAAGWLIIGLVLVSAVLASVTTPERIAAENERPGFSQFREVLLKPDLLRLFFAQIALTMGPGWMSNIYLFFFMDSRGFSQQQATILLAIYILAGFPGAFATAAVARRIGKHRTLMVTTTLYSLGLLSIFILPRANMAATAPMMAFEGVMQVGFGLMIQAMLADVSDEIRLAQGRQRTSLVYAVNTLAQKLAATLTIGISYPLLQFMKFNPKEGAVNTPAAIHNLDLTFLIGPIVFVMLGGLCVLGWRLDARRHDEVRAALDARDARMEEIVAERLPALHQPPFDPEIVG
jgi:Na+/melibiose symporter-like transporter